MCASVLRKQWLIFVGEIIGSMDMKTAGLQNKIEELSNVVTQLPAVKVE